MILIQDSCGTLRLQHTYSNVAISVEDDGISLRLSGVGGMCDACYTYQNNFRFDLDSERDELAGVILSALTDVRAGIINQAWFGQVVQDIEAMASSVMLSQ